MPTSAISEPAAFKPGVPDYDARVRSSFGRQGAMQLLGARLLEVRPGYCAIELPYRKDLTQQHGYIHAGIVSAVVDSAGGYAGFTLFPADSSVLTVEYKLNLLAPARGERLIAEGHVVRPGRTLVITRGEVYCGSGPGTRPLRAHAADADRALGETRRLRSLLDVRFSIA